ncbi:MULTISPECIES: hypothetical protein [unclassified Mesorhizobium]|uniref:hypothetical protein n=1 Tax=unclassified Mesorhizobium TaxID=325217 RepID=UPI0013E2B460|nr:MULTISPECIES: hypothetical protein [unclassified Mesorhizobium]
MSNNTLRGKCVDCGHVWVVAHLPMELSKAAQLAKRAACPKCGATKGIRVATAEDEAQA